MDDYYDILGIPSNASPEDIKKAYRSNVQRFHPDHNNGSKFHEENFKKINEAYEVLNDPSKKIVYDFYYRINRQISESNERQEQERRAREQQEQERIARERQEQERRAREQQEQERVARERQEQERRAREQQEHERVARERQEQERRAREQQEQERVAREHQEQERRVREKLEQENIARETQKQEQRDREEQKDKGKADSNNKNKINNSNKKNGKNKVRHISLLIIIFIGLYLLYYYGIEDKDISILAGNSPGLNVVDATKNNLRKPPYKTEGNITKIENDPSSSKFLKNNTSVPDKNVDQKPADSNSSLAIPLSSDSSTKPVFDTENVAELISNEKLVNENSDEQVDKIANNIEIQDIIQNNNTQLNISDNNKEIVEMDESSINNTESNEIYRIQKNTMLYRHPIDDKNIVIKEIGIGEAYKILDTIKSNGTTREDFTDHKLNNIIINKYTPVRIISQSDTFFTVIIKINNENIQTDLPYRLIKLDSLIWQYIELYNNQRGWIKFE